MQQQLHANESRVTLEGLPDAASAKSGVRFTKYTRRSFGACLLLAIETLSDATECLCVRLLRRSTIGVSECMIACMQMHHE